MFQKNIRSLLFFILFLVAGSGHAAYLSVDDLTGNHSMSTAFNLNKLFTGKADVDAGDVNNPDISYNHASIQAVTSVSGDHDWYQFSVSAGHTQAFFDIDYTEGELWSYIKLYDANGNEVPDGFNGVGEMFDPGSQVPWDSFLSMTFDTAGTYYLSVGRDNNQGLSSGQNYTLHVGLSSLSAVGKNPFHESVVATPVPGAIWLFGSALAALLSSLKQKRQSNFKA